jgi:CRISPR/Cas system-associated protein Cas10 (large subunit of type III CRISPR-Cas system)
MTNYLSGLMREQGSSWYTIYENTEANKKHLEEYKKEYETLISTLAGISYDKVESRTILSEEQYNRLELRMCNRRKPTARTDASIICKVSYTTPKGTKNYSAQRKIELSAIFARINERNEAEQSIKYQRSLMTSSKRYDIMRRDGFKCKLCGRSADEGANLEVDHILAVSRGGKSIDSNLRTLCRECNQGKKAKIE